MRWFIELSLKLGVNKIDWLRTIYFSLFGSSALTFSQKWISLDCCSGIFFVSGILLFGVGLYASMRISESFKEYERDFPNFEEETKKKYNGLIYNYIIESENIFLRKIHHVVLIPIGILACLSIGYSSYLTENKTKNQEDKFYKIENEIRTLKIHFDSIVDADVKKIIDLDIKNYHLLDSLKRVKSYKEKSITK